MNIILLHATFSFQNEAINSANNSIEHAKMNILAVSKYQLRITIFIKLP